MSEQQFHHEVMSELEMMEEALKEYNRLFPFEQQFAEFVASHEESENERT